MQSSSASTNSSPSATDDKIWQNPDLDPNTISILCTLSSNVKSLSDFQQALSAIQTSLGCSITMHGGNNSHALIWLRVKHASSDIRQQAKDQIDLLTHQPCDQIFLPSHDDNGRLESRKENEPASSNRKFKPRQEEIFDEETDEFESNRRADMPKQRNLTVTFAPSQGLSPSKNPKPKQISPPSSMSSSSSSSSISSSVFLSSCSSSSSAVLSSNSNFNANELNNNGSSPEVAPFSSTGSSPFGSILSPYNPASISSRLKSAIQHDEEMYAESRRRNQEASREMVHSSNKAITNKRYPVDVLLMRSDVPSSKKMPDNWFDLNEKYPEVCFCGKVLSYFNPGKYHDHWDKTRLRNPDLHLVESLETRMSSIELNTTNYSNRHAKNTDYDRSGFDKRSYKTDDFINVKTSSALGNANRKLAHPSRQFKFGAAISSLNEANSSNESSFRRSRNVPSGHQETIFVSYPVSGMAPFHHSSNNTGQSSRSLKYNNQLNNNEISQKRFMNR